MIMGLIFCIAGIAIVVWGVTTDYWFWRIGVPTAGVLVFIFGAFAIYGGYSLIKAPLLKSTVRVFAKLSEQNVSGGGNFTSHKYYIVFEFPDGK